MNFDRSMEMVTATPEKLKCEGAQISYFLILASVLVCILLLSHVFHLFLKPLGQPEPIAQILAGLVLGWSGLNRVPFIGSLFPLLADVQYRHLSILSRTIFMFLIGLEMDVPYTLRSLRISSTVASGGALLCSILAVPICQLIYPYIQADHNPGSRSNFTLTLMLIAASASSPLIIRIADDMKLSTSDVGRLAITASLLNDISCLFWAGFRITLWRTGIMGPWKASVGATFCFILLVVAIFLNKGLVRWLNGRNLHRQYLKNMEVAYILVVLIGLAVLLEWMDYVGDAACFFLGLMFPREGKSARTLSHKLAYPVYNIIFPLYFAYMGFQADVTRLKNLPDFIMVIVLLSLNIVGKMGGTLGACYFLKIPLNEGLLLALLLSFNGNLELLVLNSKFNKKTWNAAFTNGLNVTMVVNTLLVSPAVTFFVRRARRATTFKHVGLDWQKPDSELRILACVHGPRHGFNMTGIIDALTGPNNAITPYVMHLVELTGRNKGYVLYYTRDENDVSNDDNHYGGNEAVEISQNIDTFTAETGITVHLITAVSPYDTMHEDVCSGAEYLRASIIFLPFHKTQRLMDGKMEIDKEGIRTTNQRVLSHAPCSVGILVDKGLYVEDVGFNLDDAKRQQIAMLFFGGPDDREALTYGSRFATHPKVHLTVFRFLPTDKNYQVETQSKFSSRSNNDNEGEVVMSIPIQEMENDADQVFLSSFCRRYVTTGEVEYVEEYVGNMQETVAALRTISDMFSLFIVGKGRSGVCPFTTGMRDLKECPELGEVGDLLASSDFSVTGSVLIIQQHREPRKDAEFSIG
ncbi:cation/H(+) antiporter 1-like [Macadamia integrifolia]|uniref:cation/H(+) antiporter 1-like n=1 Tax=Macadamia integrifolia TaxID=60698 RepID=UPI001C4F51F1|nr:cation/H(+) antiporter 1-like [Macadamia integrifolia]